LSSKPYLIFLAPALAQLPPAIGVGTPKSTPTEIVDKLNKEINVALADPKTRARIADLGSPVFASSPAAFANFIAAETEKRGKVIKFAGIKPE
jgi:tripartite-type tricarboxylate transporter receptor subunit TctC